MCLCPAADQHPPNSYGFVAEESHGIIQLLQNPKYSFNNADAEDSLPPLPLPPDCESGGSFIRSFGEEGDQTKCKSPKFVLLPLLLDRILCFVSFPHPVRHVFLFSVNQSVFPSLA